MSMSLVSVNHWMTQVQVSHKLKKILNGSLAVSMQQVLRMAVSFVSLEALLKISKVVG